MKGRQFKMSIFIEAHTELWPNKTSNNRKYPPITFYKMQFLAKIVASKKMIHF